MSNVMVGDTWTRTDIVPPFPGVLITSVDGKLARFADGGGWEVDRMTDALGWRRVVPAREVAYQVRIAELTDAVERTAASGVENAARYASDLAAERRAGADAVKRIRDAIEAGATDAAQAHALDRAGWTLHDAAHGGKRSPDEVSIAVAYLALAEAHAEARATLRYIGEQALALLGKGT